MIDWQEIPADPHAGAPFHGDPVLLYVAIAIVDVVRVGWWRTGEELFRAPEDRGWWGYVDWVRQDQIDRIYTPTHWAPYNRPSST